MEELQWLYLQEEDVPDVFSLNYLVCFIQRNYCFCMSDIYWFFVYASENIVGSISDENLPNFL